MISKAETRHRIASNMRRIRKQLGLTQEDVAKATGIKQSRISRVEREESNLTATELINIAESMNSSTEALSRPLTADLVPA